MKICYISYYPYKNYPRQIQFIEALKHCELEHTVIINSKKGILGYFEIILKYLIILLTKRFGTLILGFRTTELFFILYLFSPRKRIIYDRFVPLYAAMKE